MTSFTVGFTEYLHGFNDRPAAFMEASMSGDLKERIRSLAEDLAAEVRAWREELHAHPELGMKERRTTTMIDSLLRGFGYLPFRPSGLETGAVALLEGRGGTTPGTPAVVALRADIDALPITEETGLPWASREQADLDGVKTGVMHACGHDGHTAVQLGVAKMFSMMRDEIPGTVKFIFQPGEESGGGGRIMAEKGVLKNPDVGAIFAFHCRHKLPVGLVQLAEIPNAATDSLEIDVIGRGGHGAYPHTTLDPIPVAAQIITSLQTIVSRVIPPGKPAVVSVCALQAGTTHNVIPDKVHMKGTIRTLHPEVRDKVVEAVTSIAKHTAQAAGMKAEARVFEGYPPVRCNRGLLEFVRRTASDLFGHEMVVDAAEQAMGGEDFSYFLEDQGGVPGVIFRMGVGCEHAQHSSRFDFGHEALTPAMRIMASLAAGFLGGKAGRA